MSQLCSARACARSRGSWTSPALAFLAAALAMAPFVSAQQHDRFATADSRREYVHWIELRAADGSVIVPSEEGSPPYSPRETCGKCHDYDLISQGFHFQSEPFDPKHDRPGEPWIWVDERTGTQVPVTDRGWPGLPTRQQLGIDAMTWVMRFGRNMPGGPISEPPADRSEANPRWKLSGLLEVDCLICHARDRSYDMLARSEQIERQNFQFAPTAAARLGRVAGSVKELPDDFEPDADSPDAETELRLPVVQYDRARFSAEGKVFFDITRTPPANACYGCHTNRVLAPGRRHDWLHPGDVHISRGLRCADCHPNGLGHHTVRGYDGERHEAGDGVITLSCRGCHLGAGDDPELAGGLFAAPRPAHRGLPPLHFDKLACTACHSGPVPQETTVPMQTSLAHRLGEPRHRAPEDAPHIRGPAFLPDAAGRLAPYRLVWPSYWGVKKGDQIEPLKVDVVYRELRRTLRVRREFRSEVAKERLTSAERRAILGDERSGVDEEQLTADEEEKLETALGHKQEQAWLVKLKQALEVLAEGREGVVPVYVSDGVVWQLAPGGRLKRTEHDAAQPYRWAIAHDVRPASQSLGARGCTDCHAADAPIFFGSVEPVGMAPLADASSAAMVELQGSDVSMLISWNQLFSRRTSFKWFGWTLWLIAATMTLGLCPFTNRLRQVRFSGKAVRFARVGVLVVTTSSVLVLALSGLAAMIRDVPMSGRWLQVHMVASGGLLLTLPIWSWWAARMKVWGKSAAAKKEAKPPTVWFLLLLDTFAVSAIVASGTMLASMLAWFGTEGLEALLVVHRYSGLVAAIAYVGCLATFPWRSKTAES